MAIPESEIALNSRLLAFRTKAAKASASPSAAIYPAKPAASRIYDCGRSPFSTHRSIGKLDLSRQEALAGIADLGCLHLVIAVGD
jgi:hypothetical protein